MGRQSFANRVGDIALRILFDWFDVDLTKDLMKQRHIAMFLPPISLDHTGYGRVMTLVCFTQVR